MVMTVAFKHMHPSESLKRYAHQQCLHFEKYLQGNFTLRWSFGTEKFHRIAHCRLSGDGVDYFSESSSENFIDSIEQVVAKLESQIRKHKEVLKTHSHLDLKNVAFEQ